MKLARELVWLKGYRKDVLYHGMFCYEKILKEIGRRLNLSIKQMWQFLPWEIKTALLKNKFNANILNERFKYSIFLATENNNEIITGNKAKNFFSELSKKEITINKIKELKGVCSCPGIVRGLVKIINTIDDMKKMDKGDILVSISTYPSLVPAMKKAEAIVTNTGGLTSHAAIVSREFQIPCVVGTKIATKILHDNQFVEVDATNGIVKIIK
ncbi:MAG: PEP-utilizing enzyme [Patescibacteria group bacterium]